MAKLTKEVVNERIKDRGIKLIGEFITVNHRSTFKCFLTHEWETKPSHVLRDGGCPHCSNRYPLTKKVVNERIKDRGLELIGEYLRSDKKTLFRCFFNHEWETMPSNVLRGRGCHQCNNNFPLTKKVVNERIKDRGLELIGEYINANRHSLFRCSNNHEWETKPSHVLQGKGCPQCASYGFKTNIPSHGYLLDFGHFIKFGISNVLETRLKKHRQYNQKYTIIKTKLFENGEDALDWENSIKKKYGGSYVSKDVLPDGYTETLPMFFKETLLITLDF